MEKDCDAQGPERDFPTDQKKAYGEGLPRPGGWKEILWIWLRTREEKDADAEKEEEKAEKEKESSLDKWVRKVTAEKESLVEKVKDLCATIAESQDILPQSVIRIQERKRQEHSQCSR